VVKGYRFRSITLSKSNLKRKKIQIKQKFERRHLRRIDHKIWILTFILWAVRPPCVWYIGTGPFAWRNRKRSGTRPQEGMCLYVEPNAYILFSFAVLSGNAAWRRSFLARERGEEGEWDEWEGGGHTKKRGPTFPLLPRDQCCHYVGFIRFCRIFEVVASHLQDVRFCRIFEFFVGFLVIFWDFLNTWW
jgi:hypothetical protein